jgi:hypothetical protein
MDGIKKVSEERTSHFEDNGGINDIIIILY